MISFKTFIFESALERKIINGFSQHPLEIGGAEVVHHDPLTQTTVYHLKHHDALSTFGTQCRFCTSPKSNNWSGKYLRSGNVFGVMKGTNRFQMFIPKKGGTGERTDPEFRDTSNSSVSDTKVLPEGLKSQLTKIKHAAPNYKWSKMSDAEAIRDLKGLPSGDRLSHYQAIVNSGGIAIAPGSAYDEIQKKFNKNDLHHFIDDTDHSSFLAAHAPLDDVAHLKNHPDLETQRIVKQRLSLVGGDHNIIQKEPKSTFQNNPNQLGLNLPKPKGKKQQ